MVSAMGTSEPLNTNSYARRAYCVRAKKHRGFLFQTPTPKIGPLRARFRERHGEREDQGKAVHRRSESHGKKQGVLQSREQLLLLFYDAVDAIFRWIRIGVWIDIGRMGRESPHTK